MSTDDIEYISSVDNNIHETSIIGPDVIMGTGNVIGPGAIIIGPCEIGNDNWIGPNAVVGTPGEYADQRHGDFWNTGSFGFISIGSGNTIREFVTIQVSPNTKTTIGNNCYFMTKSHIPHDANIEDDVKVACSALIGGFGHIGRGAYIGLGAIIHQRIFIGPGAMVGMGSVVTRNVPPLAKFFGSPAKLMGFNEIKAKPFGFTDKDVSIFTDAYISGQLPDPKNVSQVAASMLNEFTIK
jgi:UDP-N-acetylglucosamine acyltransferase